jgi:hypothetical protein
MSTQAELAKMTVQQFAQRFRAEMIPLSNKFAYFSALPLGEDDVRDYLEEPIAALPPAVQTGFSRIAVFLAPYLEKTTHKSGEQVTFEKPDESKQVFSAQFVADGDAVLVFSIKDRPVADYHYIFYRTVATLVSGRSPGDAEEQYAALLREEMRSHVHGEVDEQGWVLKQELLRRQSDVRRDTKMFRNYSRQSFIDTLTLYLHGICCDIDVETGPRQIPSRYLRKRLQLFHDSFPPPAGYAVFPEELKS